MSSDAENPNSSSRPKREVFDECMMGDHALLHVDTAAEGLFLPAHLLGQPTVTLKLSYHFQGETIPTNESVTAYLKFAGKYEECVVPWTAIWGMTSSKGEQTIWTESIPKQLLVELTKTKLLDIGKRFFGLEKSSKKEEDTTQTVEPSPSKSKPQATDKEASKAKPFLKRIK